jgi:signal transduction histidine kinase
VTLDDPAALRAADANRDGKVDIADVVKTLQPLVRRNGNRLDLELDPSLGEMQSDLTRVRQMLLNVLGNAAKFTERGTITLAVRREQGDDGDTVMFSVSDTGIGMSEEEQGRLFQPFSQADPSTTRRFGGTGLGLVITRRFAEQMGGTVAVESERGVGTTFTIRIPAIAQSESAVAITPVAAAR